MNRPEDDYPRPEAEAGARRMKRILLALPFAFLFLLWAGNAFIRWVWQPPIVIEGQVVDTEGKGVPDVFVIVNHWFSADDPNVHWYRPGSWFAAEGSKPGFNCAPYSRVLQTNEKGRYHLRISMHEAFGNQRYPSWKRRTPVRKFYKPGWQGSYSLYDQDINGRNVPDPFVMQPAAADIDSVSQRTGFMTDHNCDLAVTFPDGKQPDYWQRDPSWLRLYQAEYAEVWGSWCGEPGQENFEFGDFRLIVGQLDWLAQFIDAYQLRLTTRKYNELREREPKRFDKNHNILREAASFYPWDEDWYHQPFVNRRPFHVEEKQALCETLRLENYLTEEHRP